MNYIGVVVIFLSHVFIGLEWNEMKRSARLLTVVFLFYFFLFLFVCFIRWWIKLEWACKRTRTRLVCLNCFFFLFSQMKKFSLSQCMTQFHVSTYRDFSCIIHQSKRNVNQRWKVNFEMLKLKCKMCINQPLMLFASYPSSNISLFTHSFFLLVHSLVCLLSLAHTLVLVSFKNPQKNSIISLEFHPLCAIRYTCSVFPNRATCTFHALHRKKNTNDCNLVTRLSSSQY